MNLPAENRARCRSRKCGFTLVEVLVVIAIASILTMVCMPMYQTYAVRTKVSGDLTFMHPLMLRMNEEYALHDQWPSSNAAAGAHEPEHYKGRYLKSAHIGSDPQAGTMTLTYDTGELPVLLGTNTLVFYPNSSSAGANWACDQGTIPDKYRPPNCR